MKQYTIKTKNYPDSIQTKIEFKKTIFAFGEKYRLGLWIWYEGNEIFEYCYFIDRKRNNRWGTITDTGIGVYDFNDKEYISVKDSKDSLFNFSDELNDCLIYELSQPEYFIPITIITASFFNRYAL